MNELVVVYDDLCPFCRRCRAWMEHEPSHLTVRFVPARSGRAQDLCHGRIPELGTDLVAILDDGQAFTGPEAFVVCLWALRAHRPLAFRLAHPWLLPLARGFFGAVSSQRSLLSAMLADGERCEGHCGAAHRTAVYR
jgi:predicted DCC family thiol-disulfide oxidoreductase YuxK